MSAFFWDRKRINLSEISHDLAIGLIHIVLTIGVLLTEVYIDTFGDPEKYRVRLSEMFPSIKFVVAKKSDRLHPVVSGASIVAKDWVLDETTENIHISFGSGYPGGKLTMTMKMVTLRHLVSDN